MEQNNLYNHDFYLWLTETANLLKQKKFEALDLENLIEEVESMGRSEKRELLSRVVTIIEHLLKLIYWESQREENQRGWIGTIKTQRIELLKIIKQSPSLNNYLRENYLECLIDATDIFKAKTGINLNPVEVEFDLSNILDRDWLPYGID